MIAMLDPIDRVQPRSRTTCVGWLARFKGTDAIHAVCPVPYHGAVENKRNRQLSWNTNRLIPSHDHILLQSVLQRLKVQIEDEHLPCPFFFDP